MKPRIRYKFKQLLVINIGWLLIGAFFAVYDQIVFEYETSSYIFFLPEDQSLGRHILLSLSSPFLGGIFGGTFIIFYLRDKFKSYAYGKLLVLHGVSYLALIVVMAVLVVFINSSIILNVMPWSSKVVNRAISLLLNIGIWKVIVFWFFIVVLTVFLLEVNDKYGPGVLVKFISGRYHHPREECRVFMFLDLKQSTTIAEKIGSKKYFLLLKEFFDDITEPILNAKGEIYQYVGDEITVSWLVRKTAKAHCLDCYFNIYDLIKGKNSVYTEKYGIVPQFKAGIHQGIVTTGEIGQVKKEIVYSGDVLNTTSRLMEMCTQMKRDLLVSHQLIQNLKPSSYLFEKLTEFQLRGKSELINIYSVERTA